MSYSSMDAFKKPIKLLPPSAPPPPLPPASHRREGRTLAISATPSKTRDVHVIQDAQAPQPEHHVDAVLADVAASSQCLEEQPAQSRRPRSLSHPATAIFGAAIVSPHRTNWRPIYRCLASFSCHPIHRRRAIQQTRSSERPLSTPPRLLSQRSRLFSSPVAPGDLPLHSK